MRFSVRFLRHRGRVIPWKMVAKQPGFGHGSRDRKQIMPLAFMRSAADALTRVRTSSTWKRFPPVVQAGWAWLRRS